MTLNTAEKILVEAMESMLKHNAQLGIPKTDENENTSSDGLQQFHEQINDMFDIKAAGLVHYEGIRAAFHKVHNYKFIDSSGFGIALERELSGQGVPTEEIKQALEILPKIIKEFKKDMKSEQGAGFNPNLDEVIEICQPELYGK